MWIGPFGNSGKGRRVSWTDTTTPVTKGTTKKRVQSIVVRCTKSSSQGRLKNGRSQPVTAGEEKEYTSGFCTSMAEVFSNSPCTMLGKRVLSPSHHHSSGGSGSFVGGSGSSQNHLDFGLGSSKKRQRFEGTTLALCDNAVVGHPHTPC